MALDLYALSIDAHDPDLLASFWSGVLGRERVDGPAGPELLPEAEPGFLLWFPSTHEPRTGPSSLHLDLTSTSLQDQQATVDRVLALGGRHHDVGQLPEEDHVVLADPEGNEFCVVGPDNDFLAGTGPIGCLSCDGGPDVGRFWAAALGWPLVWDQGEETAIQSPSGGSKISWGGSSDRPTDHKSRLHLDLSPLGGDQAAEVSRLVSLGATPVDAEMGHGVLPVVVLADPGGNELCVLPS